MQEKKDISQIISSLLLKSNRLDLMFLTYTRLQGEKEKGCSWFGPKKKKKKKKKQCRGFRHSPAQQESSVFVGRAKRGRYHPADHMWSSSKTLREPALVRFDHRAACTGPRGLAVRQQHRGRLSPRAISVAQCSLSALPCPCIYVFAPHVHARMYLCVSCYYFPSVWERVL